MSTDTYWVYYTHLREQEGNPNRIVGIIFGDRSVCGPIAARKRVAEINRGGYRFAFYAPVLLKDSYW